MSRYKQTGPQLSGNTYVSAVYHDESVGYKNLMKIRIASPENCQHGQTICTTWTCIESWAIDHHLLFARTVGGRNLAKAVGWDANKILRPDPAKPMPAPNSDAVNKDA